MLTETISVLSRTALAAASAFTLFMLVAPSMIARLQRAQMGQMIREEGPESHYQKAGTPTMGGVLIVLATVISTLLWADLSNHYVWLLLAVTVVFSAIGGLDDVLKMRGKSSDGLSARYKYLAQSIAAVCTVVVLYLLLPSQQSAHLYVPFFATWWPLGILFFVLGYFVIVGSSNAVNLTDGLDGLAIFPSIFVAAAMAIVAYLCSDFEAANYYAIPHVPGTDELAVYCAALFGAGLGFLWFNANPALVFMGDAGSLALGAALGTLALILRQELLLLIMGGVFVMETVSVILQVASFKLRRKRIFKMSPIHHHFELSGWPESRVIVRFWILSLIFVAVGLSALMIG